MICLKRIMISMGLIVLLSGCSGLQGKDAWYRDRGKDYHRAEVTCSLEVPVSFHVKPHIEDYPVPQGYDANNKHYKVSILPPSEPSLRVKNG